MKYLITCNYGYGYECQIVEADSLDEAEKKAYEAWREGAESNADYSAKIATEEEIEEFE